MMVNVTLMTFYTFIIMHVMFVTVHLKLRKLLALPIILYFVSILQMCNFKNVYLYYSILSCRLVSTYSNVD